MHVRISMFTGAEDIDAGLDLLRDQIVPELKGQRGFQGLSAAGDRTSGTMSVISLWETETDMKASESATDKARSDAAAVMGGDFAVERFEQTTWEVGSNPPAPGCKLHTRRIKMDPAKVDENVEFFRQTVLPEFKATAGFRAVRQLIDRTTGEGRVATIWADDESLSAALANSEQRRARATAQGVEFGDEMVLEVLFAHMP